MTLPSGATVLIIIVVFTDASGTIRHICFEQSQHFSLQTPLQTVILSHYKQQSQVTLVPFFCRAEVVDIVDAGISHSGETVASQVAAAISGILGVPAKVSIQWSGT